MSTDDLDPYDGEWADVIASWQVEKDTAATWEEHRPGSHVDTSHDVRTVMAAMTAEVKDGPQYDAVPWDWFDGAGIPHLLEQIRHGDTESADRALSRLWNSACHQGTPSTAGTLAVPFLIRTALARPDPDVLLLVGSLARRPHFGSGTRTGLLRAREPADRVVFDCSGHNANWSVQAAQQAIADDTDLLLPLLDHPTATLRAVTAYALAAAAVPARDRITAALHTRFATETDPMTRASLVLAIAQLAWETRDPTTIAHTRAWWQDPTRPTEVRVSAAIAWLCLVDDPIPAELDPLLDAAAADELIDTVRWIHDADGLRNILDQMRNPDDHPWIAHPH
ncbi:hypothetical protein ACIHEI_19095 [Kitasatospora sp. NPDC051984]|uniref:hypothetical protein n=1 Tax=Kitasatospora sp. NPDC051984 TaxID=3364059 RepID=UPI0037CB4166